MVAIILVNYNGFDVTSDCLKSLENISKDILNEEFKIYVVDNAGSDGSYEKLTEYISERQSDNVILIRNKENLGFAGGNNIAVRRALEEGADYIVLLNNDTLVEKDFLGYLLEPFRIYEDCYASVGKIYYESDRNKIWYAGGKFSYRTGKTEHLRYGEKEDGRQEKIRKVTFATGCCLCISKECVQNVGLLCEDYFLYDEDTDYCLRILESGHSIYYAPKSVIYHKVSVSTGKKKGLADYYMARNRIILIKKYIKKHRLKAYFISELTYFYRCIKGEMSFKYFIKGILKGIKKVS